MSQGNKHSEPSNRPASEPAIGYGAKVYIDRLDQRLLDHFASLNRAGMDGDEGSEANGARGTQNNCREIENEPLVVGLFGPWGCGKSFWLKQLQSRFDERSRSDAAVQDQVLTIPVMFNAWRYENEPQLIVPMLKSAEVAIRRWLKWAEDQPVPEQSVADKAKEKWAKLKDKVGKAAKEAKIAALAVGSGLSGKIKAPLVGDLSFDVGTILEADRLLHALEAEKSDAEASDPPNRTTLDFIQELASTYYNFREKMLELTGYAGNGPRLNLLFLIDDLDRCLPEKAVQVLEGIKLFLDVEGCAFVLAVDDEVVERGIDHRYREYAPHNGAVTDALAHSLHPERFADFETRRHRPQAPISGTEYLEKIIHLPVQVPVPNFNQRLEHIKQTPVLRRAFEFEERVASEASEDQRVEEFQGAVIPRAKSSGKPKATGRIEQVFDEDLAELLIDLVPPVPRKTRRAIELFAYFREVAEARGWHEYNRAYLLGVAVLQLFAPAVFRFAARRAPVLIGVMSPYDEIHPDWRLRGQLRAGLTKALSDAKADPKQHNQAEQIEKIDLPLADMMEEVTHQRSGFRVEDWFDRLKWRLPDSLVHQQRYFNLALDVAASQIARQTKERATGAASLVKAPRSDSPEARVAMSASVTRADQRAAFDRKPSRISDPSLFVAGLMDASPARWENAIQIELEGLEGRRLDDRTFEALLEQVKQSPAVVDLAWLESLNPYITVDQYIALVRESSLVVRLAQEAKLGAWGGN